MKLGKLKYLIVLLPILFFCSLIFNCSTHESKVIETKTYKNLATDVKYVGMQKCAECHTQNYNTFIETGMGKSFDIATLKKTSANFSHKNVLHDKFKNYNYTANWINQKLYINEFRVNANDTTHNRTELVNYIIGSGQHTNSHLHNENGYVTQMPMTFYTQSKQWDFPPGFENGFNSRFARKIGLECMSCHNSYPDFEKGSENKFTQIPNGISCERCHGPGELHVKQFENGEVVDTSKYIDYSIVNPAKLSIDSQFDLCSRCHLQGNAVLKENKSFYDFKPGMKLSDIMTVFLPKYEHADEEFIMASHADRLKQSKCFVESAKKVNTSDLKPYKNALTCITCHNPHVGVKKTGTQIFNNACNNCHKKTNHSKSLIIRGIDNCVSCHMPKSGSVDIPHVTVHDHYIRVPLNNKKIDGIKKFIGLKAINENKPSAKTIARAYIAQYEKFELKLFYLDSAINYLSEKNSADIKSNFDELINLYFLKNDYTHVISLVNSVMSSYALNLHCTNMTYDNEHAWTAYRIAKSYNYLGNTSSALLFYKKAMKLAPYFLEIHQDCAILLATNKQSEEAEKVFKYIINQNAKMPITLNNYGYLLLNKNDILNADKFITQAIAIDPDYENALLNKIAIELYKGNNTQAKILTQRVLKINKENTKAKALLEQLNKI